jgi:nicotinic acid phosphoribosyltransferase
MAADLRPKPTSPPPPKRRSIKYLVILIVAFVTGLFFFLRDINKHDQLKSVVKGESGFYGVRFDSNKWREVTLEKPAEFDLDFWYLDPGIIAFTIVDREIH